MTCDIDDDAHVIEWDGRLWHLDRTTGYYKAPRGGKYLHRAVYEKANGPIPRGHVIHHIDGDPCNNNLDNLRCMSHREHDTFHGNGQYVRDTSTRDEAGARSRAMWERWRQSPRTYVCEECGETFVSASTRGALTCSLNCRQRRYRRMKKQGETA